MNYVSVCGRLSKDPEVRSFGQENLVYLNFAQCTRKRDEKTIWWSASFKESHIAKIMPHLKKGSAVIITGTLKNPEIYASNGEDRVALRLIGSTINFNPFGKSETRATEPVETKDAENQTFKQSVYDEKPGENVDFFL